MPEFEFITIDVFTDRRFGGNPLAVFPDAEGISDADQLALAGEFNLSEITFVLPPSNPAHTARVRIYGPKVELPFAGHPNVGTALVLAARRPATRMVFEELAGLVTIDLADGRATFTAPQPLQRGPDVPVATVAACLGFPADQVVTATHAPVIASMGLGFAVAEVTPTALAAARTDIGAFHAAMAHTPSRESGFSLLVYTRSGTDVRARMFAPVAGIPEDPATGSANAALVGLLLDRLGGDTLALTVQQGVEMGRPSVLHSSAYRAPEGIRARVGGGGVQVMRGVVQL